MKSRHILLVALMSVMLLPSCKDRQQKSEDESKPAAEETSAAAVTDDGALSEAEEIASITPEDLIGEESENKNPFFSPYPSVPSLLEANANYMPEEMSKKVSLGRGAGEATFILEKNGDSVLPLFEYRGKMFELSEICEVPADFSTASIAAWDLDNDGVKEVLLHTGEMMVIFIMTVTGNPESPLKCVGSMSNNWEFFVTDDGVIVSMCGSQGSADKAVLRNGRLEMLEYDGGIDKLLISSKAFHNLEYVFEDNSAACRVHTPLLQTRNYIICHSSDMRGDHAMDVDLDGDGVAEQLYMGNPGWGATDVDIIRVNSRKESLSLEDEIMDDPVVIRTGEYEWVVRDYLQLSAVDVDGDGRLEVVLTGGTPQRTSTYVFDYRKDALVLLNHFVKNGVVKEEEL